MPKHFIFDKLQKKNRLKIALQVSKLGFSPIVMPLLKDYNLAPGRNLKILRQIFVDLSFFFHSAKTVFVFCNS